ncbi:unnamed protein product [Brassica oleracea]
MSLSLLPEHDDGGHYPPKLHLDVDRTAIISTDASVSPFHHIVINSTLKSCYSQKKSHLGLQSFLTSARGSMM